MKTYSNEEAKPFLDQLVKWTYNNNAIERDFLFKNFSQSLAFIVQVGILSEKVNHHPEIFNVYNKVNIRLSTHDANGVTNKDFDLARAIDTLGF